MRTAATLSLSLIHIFVAMLALVFICLLFFNLFSQLVGFVYSLYKELALRT